MEAGNGVGEKCIRQSRMTLMNVASGLVQMNVTVSLLSHLSQQRTWIDLEGRRLSLPCGSIAQVDKPIAVQLGQPAAYE
jgi:hypothetical protein